MDSVDEPVGRDDPVRVRSAIDAPSRRLWLAKWCVLAVPHYPILIGLYLLYPLVTIAAGIAILFTGRYPRPLFDFNVGVLRWSWRLMNYRFPMNSTDKYPPFTLASVPDYPADLEVDYPESLTNRAVLVATVATRTSADNPLLVAGAISAGAVRRQRRVVGVRRHDQPGHVRPSDGHRQVALSGGRLRLADARRVSAVPNGSG